MCSDFVRQLRKQRFVRVIVTMIIVYTLGTVTIGFKKVLENCKSEDQPEPSKQQNTELGPGDLRRLFVDRQSVSTYANKRKKRKKKKCKQYYNNIGSRHLQQHITAEHSK